MADRRLDPRLHRVAGLFRPGEVPAWRADAACHGRTALFYSPDRNDRAEAVAICEGCPVLEACRFWALARPDPVPGGIAGGLTHGTRIKLRRAELRGALTDFGGPMKAS